jgi:hypothetical protein
MQYKAQRHSRKLRNKSRAIPLKGNKVRANGEDDGKYYRCWNCGFICDVTRDSIGGSQSGSGDNHEDFYGPALGVKDATDKFNSLITLRGASRLSHVLLENGSDGDPKEIRHDFTSVVTGGCPLCGTYNYKGDYK